ncbi:hypothetical protein RCL1_006986 [Eukaryota sp. TZLM3-RCL]
MDFILRVPNFQDDEHSHPPLLQHPHLPPAQPAQQPPAQQPPSKDQSDHRPFIENLLKACGDTNEPHEATIETLLDFAQEFLDGFSYAVADKGTRNLDCLVDYLYGNDPIKRSAAIVAHDKYKIDKARKEELDKFMAS